MKDEFKNWIASPKKNSRLKKWHVLGPLNGRARPLIADNIRSEEHARLIASAPCLKNDLRLENELREAYFTLWAAVENGIDTDTFFKLRETFRGIRSMVEEDDFKPCAGKKVNIGVTSAPVRPLDFNTIKPTGPTIEQLKKDFPAELPDILKKQQE